MDFLSFEDESDLDPFLNSTGDYTQALASLRKLVPADVRVLAEAIIIDSEERRRRALACLAKLVSTSKKAASLIRAEGLIMMLTLIISEDKDVGMQCDALSVLAYVAESLDKPTIEQIVRLVDSLNTKLRCKALFALKGLAAVRSLCETTFFQAGASMRRCLTPDNDVEVIRAATGTLKAFIVGKAARDDVKMAACGLLHPRLFDVDDAIVRCNLLAVAQDCVEKASEGHDEMLGVGIAMAPRLPMLAQSSTPAVALAAFKCAGSMAASTEQCTQAIVDAGIIPVLKDTLTSGKQKGAEEAAWTVSNICAGTVLQKQAIIDADMIPLLISLLYSTEPKLRQEAFFSLTNTFSDASPQQVSQLISQGVLQHVHTMIQLRHEPKARPLFLMDSAVNLMEICLQNDVILADVGLSVRGEIKEYCDSLEFPSMLLQLIHDTTNARNILQTHFAEYGSAGAIVAAVQAGSTNADSPLAPEDLEDALYFLHYSGWRRRRHAIHAWKAAYYADGT